MKQAIHDLQLHVHPRLVIARTPGHDPTGSPAQGAAAHVWELVIGIGQVGPDGDHVAEPEPEVLMGEGQTHKPPRSATIGADEV